MIGIVCAFFHTEGKGFYSNHQLRLCSRGSADPRESLRRCWISKLALTAHKVLPEQKAEARFWVVNWGRDEWLRGRVWEKGAGRITVVGSDPSRAFSGGV